ncbi:MAG: RHS repeat-associated core domain-containing protein [Aestuariibacter sp.]
MTKVIYEVDMNSIKTFQRKLKRNKQKQHWLFFTLLFIFCSAAQAANDMQSIIRTTYAGANQSVAVRNTVQTLSSDFETGVNNWQSAFGGSWQVIQQGNNNVYRQSWTSGTKYSSYPLAQTGKMSFSWQMRFDDKGNKKAGMLFMASDTNNRNHGDSYMVWQAPSEIRIYKYLANNRVSLVSAPLSANHNTLYAYRVEFDTESGHIDVWREENLVISWVDIDPLTEGQFIGLRTNYSIVDFDNVRVEKQDSLVYLHSDHLGSTNAMSDKNGELSGEEERFYPFGEYRTGGQSSIVDTGFTGHKENRDIGLTYMNARYFVAGLGRFASADTIVPDPGNSQQFNRYSYVLNNPTLFTDPTGHCVAGAQCPEFIEKTAGDIKRYIEGQIVNESSGAAHQHPERDHLLLAKCVYLNGCVRVNNWKRELGDNLRRYGFTEADFQNEFGFNAGLFRNVETGEFFIAFAGTEIGATDKFINDLYTDARQAIGILDEQYIAAAELGLKARELLYDVTVGGHSLGAGLAGIAALFGDFDATNINPAGVHPDVLAQLEDKYDIQLTTDVSKINYYYTRNDELTYVQNLIDSLPGPIGNGYLIGPPANGTYSGHALSSACADIDLTC